MNDIIDFFLSFKSKICEVEEILDHQKTIKKFSNSIRESQEFIEIYDNYLNIRGFTHRLDSSKERLFYTFSEAVYAIDTAKLMRDEAGLNLNARVYSVVLDECIKEYNGEAINEEELLKAKAFYKEQEELRAKEAQKYHVYQY